MPTCQHCHHEWTYGETIRKTFRIKKRCPNCHHVNYVTAKSQWRMNLSSLLGFLIFPLSIFDVSITGIIFIGVCLFMIIVGTFPFIEQFSKEKEYLT
ncbi:TIGR04104 family putative zinc finger protein [Lentibacillus sp. Marseille-P4043]|uniref:TIGR04104 family putative zinc finger protein n=1 Tax=Lentibacillus sp. Marseille-P4043 TaxID=2040293 RepID=UPI000D0B057A|nr:TIGR04104 family putative zinc finger protein [Lentibacillus sp. Marseille-P4043]